MASLTTNKFRALLCGGTMTGGVYLNLITDTIKVMLVGTGYTPDKDHDFVNSITAATSKELSGTGYTGGFGGSGRKALASKTANQDNTNDWSYYDAADVTWTGLNAGTIAYAVVIREVTNDLDSPILCVIDVTDLVTNGSDVTLQFATDGIWKLS